MSADFWAGYASGAIGILVGNPLDLIKTRLQAGSLTAAPNPSITAATAVAAAIPSANATPLAHTRSWTSLARGAAAPCLGYGALNALLFVTYNRSLSALNPGLSSSGSDDSSSDVALAHASAASIWAAGALGGLATFVVSAPTELIKCRTQVGEPARSSLDVARDLWVRGGGVRGLYVGGAVTSARDAVGYGFYFWSYELSKRALAREDDGENQQALKVLLCGGLAGIVTWASIFPLDVIKTRVQTWDLRVPSPVPAMSPDNTPLLHPGRPASTPDLFARPSTLAIAREAYEAEGRAVFFRGLGVCSARAFIVNAIQWAVYEWMMRLLAH